MAEVDHLRIMTALYRVADYRHGGGALRGELAAFVDRAARLLDGQYTEVVINGYARPSQPSISLPAGHTSMPASTSGHTHSGGRPPSTHGGPPDGAHAGQAGTLPIPAAPALDRTADALMTIRETRIAAAGKVTSTVEAMLGCEESGRASNKR